MAELAELIERILEDQSKEEDKLIEMYHNQIKRMYFRNCLYQIDYHYKDMEDARNEPREGWDDDNEIYEYNIWKPSNVKSQSYFCLNDGCPVPSYQKLKDTLFNKTIK